MKKSFLLITIFFISYNLSKATHNRAGEITYTCDSLNPFHFYFTITTYTKLGETADRCDLTVFFCDFNDSAIFFRVNGPTGICAAPAKMGEPINGTVKKNIYTGEHTFGSGPLLNCKIMIEDPNRNGNINNIPGSIDVPFFIVSTLSINPFAGCNSSPVLLNPPIENACYCKPFVHNPGAYDPDGDSLSYSLIKPFGAGGVIIPCYVLPSGASINPVTGDLTWACPGAETSLANCNSAVGAGEYNFAILIKEWRNGRLIGTVERDMQVTVDANCNNNPPVVHAKDTCVEAGSFFSMEITAEDTPFNGVLDTIKLIANGGPFQMSPDSAEFVDVCCNTSVSSVFQWQTNCNQVRKQPYNVTFIATDDNNKPLSDSKTIKISIIGPAPVLTAVTPIGNSLVLTWLPYTCPTAIGYKIYRKLGCSNTPFDFCETGIPASSGYQYVTTINDLNTLTYTDDNGGAGLLHGQEYSYKIFAFFADGSESRASIEKCAMLKRNVAIITNVSIFKTDSTIGKDTIRWVRPTDFDSIIQYPPPYRYLIYRGATLIDSTDGIANTIYIENNLNTEANQYTYRIDFYTINNHTLIGKSNTASSVKASAVPSDNSINLSTSFTVPWTNYKYYFYKENPTLPDTYTLLNVSNQNSFTDVGLINGRKYCYRVLTEGEYSDITIAKPLYNMSQKICAVPIDITAPCAPSLSVAPDCDNLLNILSWNNPNLLCADDVVGYKIYFSTKQNDTLRLIDTITTATTIKYMHTPDSLSIAGCYSITALDSFNNESVFSDTICVDNCPIYELPNVFTPSGDGINDLFKPFPYRFIRPEIEMYIYDRWGVLIFETNNIKVLWDGFNYKSKQECDDGVFYYVCTIKEIRLAGDVPRTLKGFVQKISSEKDGKAK